jgi:hypothetical protein
MLRDDSNGTTPSFDSSNRAASFDSLDKEPIQEKGKDEKKKKEKKPGMLSGLFKRKDKKGRSQDGEGDPGKQSDEYSRSSPQPKTSEESSPIERSMEGPGSFQPPQRQTSKGKLQKPPPSDNSPLRTKQTTEAPTEKSVQDTSATSLRPVETNVQVNSSPEKSPDTQARSPEEAARDQARAEQKQGQERSRSNSRSGLNPIGLLRSNTLDNNPIQQAQPEKREKVKKAKKRMELDIDSDDETPATATSTTNPWNDAANGRSSQQKSRTAPIAEQERLSESPVQITAADATDAPSAEQHPPGLVGDSSSQDTPDVDAAPSPPSPSSPILPPGSMPGAIPSSPPISPSTFPAAPGAPPSHAPPAPPGTSQSANPSELDLSNSEMMRSMDAAANAASGSVHSSPQSASEPWSPTSLRNYLDDGSEIRDFLMVVRDVRGVTPVSKDHPILDGLYVREQDRCDELGRMLDGLLGELVSRRKAGPAASKSRANGQRADSKTGKR